MTMTKEDLLALIATSFSQEPQAVSGGHRFRHTPEAGDLAYLGLVYDPASPEDVAAWAERAYKQGNPYLSFLTKVANGLQVANICLYGVIQQIDRSGVGMGQPISLDYGNVVERTAGLDLTEMVIGGSVGWSSRGNYVMNCKGAVRLVHDSDGGDVAAEWPSLEAMLHAEFARIAPLHDAEGRRLGTYTDLMHPNGRRWETDIEPESTRH